MTSTRTFGAAISSLLAGIVLLACGNGDQDDGPDGSIPDAGWIRVGGDAGVDAGLSLARCGWPEDVVLTSRAGDAICSGTPQIGDVVSLRTDGTGQHWVRFGADEVPVTLRSDCALAGFSCAERDGGTWSTVELSLAQDGGVFEMNWAGERIDAFHSGESCDGIAYTGVPVDPTACDVQGAWVLEEALVLTSGECNTSWDVSAVSFEEKDGELQLSWGSSNFGPVDVAGASCGLAATKGVSDPDAGVYDLWIWNGVERSAVISATLASSDLLLGTISDRLAEDVGGFSCPGGTWSFSAVRRALPAEPLDPVCTAPRPWLRDDAICDATLGEGCFNSIDCACGMGMQCAGEGQGTCLKLCDYFADDCGAGERCGHVTADPTEYTQGYCQPEGPVGLHEACSKGADCASGLMCLVGKSAPISGGGLCVPKCARWNSSGPGCGTGEVCETVGQLSGCMKSCNQWTTGTCGDPDLFCYGRYDNVPGQCFLRSGTFPGQGETCDMDIRDRPQCDEGMRCVGSNGTEYCTKVCNTADDCPAGYKNCFGSFDHKYCYKL